MIRIQQLKRKPGHTREQLETVRAEKEAERGAFRKRLLLLEVQER